MKNDFFEAFNEIDEKYINEAANSGYEVSYAEEIKPVGFRKRIYPVAIKYAACAAVIGAAVFAVSSAAGFGRVGLTPNSPGTADFETEEVYFKAVTLAQSQDETEEADTETATAAQEQSETVYTSAGEDMPPEENGLSQEETESAREAAQKDWASRTLVSPTDSELPDYYTEYTSAFYARKFTGWAGMVLPAPGKGSEVKAISYGEVVYAGFLEANMYHAKDEYFVVIKHNDYVYTGYSGIDPNPSLKAGDTVEAGQCVGYANLLWELWEDGRYAFSYNIGDSNFAMPVEYAE